MSRATVGVMRFTLAVALPLLTALSAARADAQVLRGIAKTLDGGRPIERAQVMALDMNGKAISDTRTDDKGRFVLRVGAGSAPFVVSVRRIGMQPTSSDPITMINTDTLEVQFLVAEVGVYTDTVKVTAKPSLNDIRLAEAKRRGWRIFSPQQVAERRESVNSFGDLIRTMGYPGLIVGRRPDECIRSTRYNRCLTIVLDGTVMGGGNPLINPGDVYFMAVLSASDATVQYGDRAPWGAIVVYTRMRGDKIEH